MAAEHRTGKSEITQDEYDAFVAVIRAGNVVNYKGRRAHTLDDLHFILDARDIDAPPPIAPGVPMILGLGEAQSQMVALEQENAQLRAGKEAADAEVTRRGLAMQEKNAALLTLEKQVEALTVERDSIVAVEGEAQAEKARLKGLLTGLQEANDGLVAELKALKAQTAPPANADASPAVVLQSANAAPGAGKDSKSAKTA